MNMELRTKTINESFRTRNSSGEVMTAIYEPGDGTRYVAVVTVLSNGADAYASPMVREHLGISGGGFLAFIEGYGTIVLARTGLLHWRHIQGKLKVSERTAVILGELLGTLTGRPFVSCEMYLADRAEAV